MAKEIKFDRDAKEALKRGIDKLANTVSMTLGPRGRAVVIEKGYGAPQVTFDGVTVAKEIELENKYENLGAEFIKQAADKTNDDVGDGTTTSVVLAHSMIEEGEKLVREKGFNVIKLAEALKDYSENIIKGLTKQAEPINDERVEEVASLSSKDPEVGKLIAEVIKKTGKDGVITVEDSNSIENTYEFVEGMQFDRGYISPYMVTDADKMSAEIDNPYILVTDKKISSVNDIVPILEKVMKTGKKELFIIADDVDGEALATLVLNKLRGVFNVLAVKAPGFGDRKKEMLRDICILTGAEFVSEDTGRTLENVDVTDLGQADKVISTKEYTTIVGGKGNDKAIKERIAQIKAELERADSDFDKEKLQERLGKLSGGVAVIKVGAATESAQKELKQRVEDAVHATKAAMEEGIVPGGGVALYNLKDISITPNKNYDKEITAAVEKIFRAAAVAPLISIIENSGEQVVDVLREMEGKKDDWVGFNAISNKVENLKDAGIIDPLKVTKTAFMNAVSVASTYLTIGAAITEIPEKEDKASDGNMM